MKPRTIAVAGGFGFVGANIVEALRHRGYDVHPFSRRSGVDILDYGGTVSFLSNLKPDVLVNCAAHVGGIAYNQIKPVEVYQDNLMIGFNIVKAANETKVGKFVNVMPNCVYPGEAEIYTESGLWDGPMHDTVLTYGMPRKAIWVHSWALRTRGFNSIHLILPNLYGPRDHFDPVRSHALGAIIKKVIDAKLEGQDTVEIWGTGNPIREWGYVEDIAEGVVLATERYEGIDVMNIGEGKGYTIREVAELVRKAAKWDGQFQYNLSKPDGAPRKILDVQKMRRTLDWEPKTSIEEGIAKTVSWYEKNRASIEVQAQ